MSAIGIALLILAAWVLAGYAVWFLLAADDDDADDSAAGLAAVLADRAADAEAQGCTSDGTELL